MDGIFFSADIIVPGILTVKWSPDLKDVCCFDACWRYRRVDAYKDSRSHLLLVGKCEYTHTHTHTHIFNLKFELN
ncbi:hypothetical protein EUGRSUZ_K02746 [Eucalyptus grandis]|uniref:Uncharacterized protein n=2 Tax=Eucalyptus grandis TaxID=71139 RepID=A0ACC3IX83_EUCGR|nr:hypothetical protein EUGRSUZ_K02746 [Eucalyptus grandis]